MDVVAGGSGTRRLPSPDDRRGRGELRSDPSPVPTDPDAVVSGGVRPWYAEREARKQEKRDRPAKRSRMRYQPPEPTGWLSIQEDAEPLGVKPRDVHHLVKRGHLRSSRTPLRVWVTADSVEARRARQVDDRHRWVSYVEAARIAGCGLYAIKQAVKAGQIEYRSAPRREPSLLRSSVEAFNRSLHQGQRVGGAP